MSSIIKGNYINYNKDGPVTIESKKEAYSSIESFEDIEMNSRMSIEEKERIFVIEMEQKKNKIIEQALIEAKVQANQERVNMLDKANKDSQDIIDKANAILDEANVNSELIRKEAFEKGYEDGMNEMQEKIAQANEILQDIIRIRITEIEAIAPEIVELIGDLFEKVIGAKLNADEELILSLIENTLKSYELKDCVVVKVSKEDYNVVTENKQHILSKLRNIDDIEIVKQDSLQKGDCIVQTQSGDIDSSITKQLECFKITIEDILRNGLYDDES